MIREGFQVLFFDLFSKLLLGLASMLVIRYMSEVEFARYTFGLSLVLVVNQVFSGSFKRVYIVGNKSLKLENSMSAFLGFQVLCLCVLFGVSIPFRNLLADIYAFVVILVFATCLSEFCKTAFQQELKFVSFSAIEILRSGLFFIGLLIFLFFESDELRAWQVMSIKAGGMIAAFLPFLLTKIRPRGLFDIGETIRIAKSVAEGSYKYLFGYLFLLAMFSQIDIFMLKALADDRALSTYGSAFRYYSLLMLSLGAVHAVLLPVVQRLEEASELDKLLSDFNKMVLLFAPIVLFGVWSSKWIIPWIDKGKYPEAVAVFRILSVSAVISFTFSPHVNLILRMEDFKFLLILIGFGVVLSVALNSILIPSAGATGAAVATLISFAFITVSIYLRAKSRKELILG